MTQSNETLNFEDPVRTAPELDDPHKLVLNLEGFEGPLDVLLTLARAQKVDLSQISMVELVEQYLVFVAEAKRLRLELAADYLVMAAWLAYLKSRLLIPRDEEEEGPSAEELALRLQLRLQRLEAMREAGARLMSRNVLGRDVFKRGDPQNVVVLKTAAYDVTLYELLKAYAEQRVKTSVSSLKIAIRPVMPLEDALNRLSHLLGTKVDWCSLEDFLPKDKTDNQYRKSALASMFAASLELARQGKADISQNKTYGPLFLKPKAGRDDDID